MMLIQRQNKMIFLLEYKWWILGISETIAWLATFYICLARYWLKSKLQFFLFGGIAVITGYSPHITLIILDYIKYGEVHFFSVFVLTLLLLGVTVFKKYLMLIDKSIQQWANKNRAYQEQE
jgi:hypothetical protein